MPEPAQTPQGLSLNGAQAPQGLKPTSEPQPIGASNDASNCVSASDDFVPQPKKRGRPRKHDNIPRKNHVNHKEHLRKYEAKVTEQANEIRDSLIEMHGDSFMKRPSINEGREIKHTERGNVIVERDPVTNKIIKLSKNSVGQPVALLSEDQKLRFLELVEAGMGIHLATRVLKVSKGLVKRTLELDPNFKEAYELHEACKIEECKGTIWAAAVGGNITAAAIYIRLRSESTRAKRELAYRERELKLREESAARLAGLELDKEKPNWDNLDEPEFNLFTLLHERIKNGQKLDINDKVKYASLMTKIFSPPIDRIKTPKEPKVVDINPDNICTDVDGCGWDGKQTFVLPNSPTSKQTQWQQKLPNTRQDSSNTNGSTNGHTNTSK